MSKKIENEKKAAIKILNNYADKYILLLEENKNLQKDIKDLKANLKINKEIMSSFYSNSNNSKDLIINKLKEENLNLYEILEKTAKERDTIRSKLLQLEENIESSIGKINKEKDNLSTKLFLAEQELFRKSTTIGLLKKKILKIKHNKKLNDSIILDPNSALIKISDELYLYKEIYIKLIQSLKRYQNTINKYELLITKLQNEIMKLKNKYRLSILSANRDKETYLSLLSQNTRNATSDNTKLTNSQNLPNISLLPSDDFKLKTKLKLDEGNYYANLHSFDEFAEILRNVGLTKTEFQRMTKMKTYNKLTDAVEMIFGFLIDKNSTIKILQIENENLTNKNFTLNKENMILNFEIKKIKNQYSIDKKNNNNNNNNNNNDLRDETLSNNASQITLNRALNIDLFKNYQKLIENHNNEDEIPKNFDNLGLTDSLSKKYDDEDSQSNYDQFIGKYVIESSSFNIDSSIINNS